jgi:hypothetical protein
MHTRTHTHIGHAHICAHTPSFVAYTEALRVFINSERNRVQVNLDLDFNFDARDLQALAHHRRGVLQFRCLQALAEGTSELVQGTVNNAFGGKAVVHPLVKENELSYNPELGVYAMASSPVRRAVLALSQDTTFMQGLASVEAKLASVEAKLAYREAGCAAQWVASTECNTLRKVMDLAIKRATVDSSGMNVPATD